VIAALAGALLMHDVMVPPSRAFGARIAVRAIDQYRAHVSPHMRSVVRCRFVPSCSAYGRESIQNHGLLAGGIRTAWRIARCGPWTKMGTVDRP
jgi:putative membrane protein insertion efficiency factor